MILGAALLIVLITVAVLRLRQASRVLDDIMVEHNQRMSGVGSTSRRYQGRHRRPGRAPRTVAGYPTHRRRAA